ncbi:MAG: 4Fe-4S dicluster domain-containing protein, partial [Clostridiales bacterium]|nr:4Fe-4S dicluster domain-containing protein [Clostridiales bacterium]
VNPRKCMKCGKCSATCPSYSEIDIPPHRFVMMVENGEIEALLSSQLLWKCLSCFACVERCPRGVEPSRLVEAVRLLQIRGQGKNYMTPDDVPKFIETDEEIPQQLITSALRKYSK